MGLGLQGRADEQTEVPGRNGPDTLLWCKSTGTKARMESEGCAVPPGSVSLLYKQTGALIIITIMIIIIIMMIIDLKNLKRGLAELGECMNDMGSIPSTT
jgi:hypothetical protein